jgi:hypothetical protein
MNQDFNMVDGGIIEVRFICGFLLQISLNHDSLQGLLMDKYITNHFDKFERPITATIYTTFKGCGTVATFFVCIILLC